MRKKIRHTSTADVWNRTCEKCMLQTSQFKIQNAAARSTAMRCAKIIIGIIKTRKTTQAVNQEKKNYAGSEIYSPH
jgi:hypothetical protein